MILSITFAACILGGLTMFFHCMGEEKGLASSIIMAVFVGVGCGIMSLALSTLFMTV